MFKALIDWYLGALKTIGYPAVTLLMAIESSVVPLPSELVIPPAAHWAHTGQLPLTVWGVVLAGTIGSWLGATMMYWLSRLAGRPLVLRYGRYIFIPPEKVEGARTLGATLRLDGHFHFALASRRAASHWHSRRHRADGLQTILAVHTVWLGSLVRGAGLRRHQSGTKRKPHARRTSFAHNLDRRRNARARRTLLLLRPSAHEAPGIAHWPEKMSTGAWPLAKTNFRCFANTVRNAREISFCKPCDSQYTLTFTAFGSAASSRFNSTNWSVISLIEIFLSSCNRQHLSACGAVSYSFMRRFGGISRYRCAINSP